MPGFTDLNSEDGREEEDLVKHAFVIRSGWYFGARVLLEPTLGSPL